MKAAGKLSKSIHELRKTVMLIGVRLFYGKRKGQNVVLSDSELRDKLKH